MASCSGVASARRVDVAECGCHVGATPFPMWRMDNATKNLSSGRVFAASRLASSLAPLADRAPDLVVKKSVFLSFSSVRLNRSPSSVSRPASSSACPDW